MHSLLTKKQLLNLFTAPKIYMSTKTFCDICQKEITIRGEEITVWSHPLKSYCVKCWAEEKNWPKIHKLTKNKKTS